MNAKSSLSVCVEAFRDSLPAYCLKELKQVDFEILKKNNEIHKKTNKTKKKDTL